VAVLVGVVLARFFGMVHCVSEVAVRDVRVMPGLFMIAGFMLFRSFAVVLSGVLMMLGCLMMMRSALVIIHGG
jgi:hypothetical protein